jgi:hypothetical protein
MIQVYKEAFKARATSLTARRIYIIVQNIGEFVVTSATLKL